MTSAYIIQGNEKCWICLGEGDEVPPMGDPVDAHDWVKPCACSLVAHKKCLINWILSVDMDKRKEVMRESQAAAAAIAQGVGRNDDEIPDARLQQAAAAAAQRPPQQQSISLTILNSIGINIRTENIGSRFIPDLFEDPNVCLSVKCPQCSNPLFLQSREDRFNRLVQYIKESVTHFTKYAFFTSLISTSVASTIAGILASLSGAGIQILNVLCPESVQMNLLHIPAKSLLDALNKNILTLRFFTVTAALPIYLHALRVSPLKTSNPTEAFIQLFPLLFLSKLEDLNFSPRFRMAVFALNFSRYAYRFVFSLTANRFYYRWVKASAPSFIADKLSLEELERIQKENEEEYEIKLEENENALKERGQKKSLWEKVVHYFEMRSKLKALKRSRRNRELQNCLKYDYSSVFDKSSIFFNFFTTMLWPLLGATMNRVLLSKTSYILKFLNRYSRTPDEAIFLGNILGCCCIVLLKDLVKLFITWRKTKQMHNIHIVEYGSDEWTRYTLTHLQRLVQTAEDEAGN